MKKKIILLLCMAMLLAACCVGCGKNDKIKFSDVTMKKYVLKELGKKPDEDVTYKEAEQLKSLTIDRTYRNFVTVMSNVSMQSASGSANGVISMDLSDLKYFTGLESLEIDNSSDDNFIGWESIEKCTNLQGLKMNYYEDSYYMPLGEKPILGFVDKLKNLKRLDCMYGNVTQATMNKIKAMRPDVEVNVVKEYIPTSLSMTLTKDTIKPNLYVIDVQNDRAQPDDTLLIEGVNKPEDYRKIIDNASATDIKYIYIKIRRGQADSVAVDCKDFTKFTNLETLSITETTVTTDGKVENINELSKLPYLTTFCINGDYNPDEICELKHVDTLSISGAKQDVDLSSMKNLKKVSINVTGNNVKLPSEVEVLRTANGKLANTTPALKIMCDYGAEDCTLDYLKNCSKLKYFYWSTNKVTEVDLSAVKNLPDLEYLSISKNKITSGFEILSDMKNLRVVQLKYVIPSEMSKLKDMKSKDSLSFFGFLDTDGQYPARDYQEALGISGKVTYLSIYYNVPGMIDLYKSGVTNSEIMQGENTYLRDTFGFDETFGTIR